MTKVELLEDLSLCRKTSKYDFEVGHKEADMLLLEYINDSEISEAYKAITRYYA